MSEHTFNVTISQTLSKTVPVKTNQYIIEEKTCDEEGTKLYYNTQNTDWEKVIENSYIYTPQELLIEFDRFLEYDLEEDLSETERQRLTRLQENCRYWCNDETEIIPE